MPNMQRRIVFTVAGTASESAASILLGFAGGSGAGKSVIVNMLFNDLRSHAAAVIQQDAYYQDLSHLSIEERSGWNFDHPDAVDSQLLIRQIRRLLNGGVIEVPMYDFTNHTRRSKTRHVGPVHVIFLEGILIFTYPELCELMDLKIFVDADPEIRLMRRIQRDTKERGRTPESVIGQYESSVRPMHDAFVEPSKQVADIIIPGKDGPVVAVNLLRKKIESLMRERNFI